MNIMTSSSVVQPLNPYLSEQGESEQKYHLVNIHINYGVCLRLNTEIIKTNIPNTEFL